MTEDRKEWVKERYGAIAQSSESCCCSSSCCDSTSVAQSVGYKAEDLAEIPEGANLGLGCGNPLGIASVRPGETVLDLGSGAGVDVFLAAKRVTDSGKVIGLDMTPAMIQTATKNAEQGGYKNVEFRLGDIEDMPIESCSIDLIISNCVLNLVPDKKRAFAEIFRVLKPGGRITVSDIVLDGDLPASLDNDRDAYCQCISGAMKRNDYLQGLRDAGLAEVAVARESDSSFGYTEIEGIATSVTVTAKKPKGCCCCG